MLTGTPSSMSFSMHRSKAKAATREKKLCTFSPENNVKHEEALKVALAYVEYAIISSSVYLF